MKGTEHEPRWQLVANGDRYDLVDVEAIAIYERFTQAQRERHESQRREEAERAEQARSAATRRNRRKRDRRSR